MGLLFYKPQLAMAVAVVMCVSLGRRAVLGVMVSGTLLAGDVIRHGAPRKADRWLMRAWVAIYLYSYVSPAVAARTFVHVEVLLLGAVALLQIGRVMARAERVVPVPETDGHSTALAA